MEKKKSVLIVEDEQVLGDILYNKLFHEGYKTNWCTDGESGLAQIKKEKPDLVLLDIVMPKMDGYEVLEAMYNDPELKKIPVVVISNSGQPVEIERILKLGAKDYIVKAQFSPEEVLAKVKRYMGDEKVSTTTKSTKTGNGLKVLVVEDDPFLLSLASEKLIKEGYVVTNVTDGGQALKELETNVPDLILLDVIMPVMNGFEVLKKIKSEDRLKNIPVIIFSNLGQEHEIEEGKQLGADDFLVKAKFTLGEVAQKIEALLKRKGKLQ